MKLLRPFTGTGTVFWPIGRPPDGTCEFATTACLSSCYAALPQLPDFDEEIRIPEDEKWQIYELMMNEPLPWLHARFLEELDGLQTTILHWFGSGDCQLKDIDRVLELIRMVGVMVPNITQMGFTRNKELWEIRKDVFALSVDSEKEIGDQKGMFSVADYVNGTSRMFRDGIPTRGGLCGPTLCEDRTDTQLTHFINCAACQRLRTGCFDREE